MKIRYLVISALFLLIILGGITKSGIIYTKDSVGFLMDNNSFSNFINQIPANKMNDYLNHLQVTNLQVAVNNLPPNSVLRNAVGILGNDTVPNAWEIINDNNNNKILQFSKIVNDIIAEDINFTSHSVNANTYPAAVVWDPNLSNQVAWGISYNRDIYKIYRDGSNIVVEQKRAGSSQENGGIAAAIGDFNGDGKADFFVIKTNENNSNPTKVQEAAVFVQGSNETFSKQTINTNSWDQGQTKVDVKWTAGAVTAQFQKWDDQQKRYVVEKFDYNGDGKQDVLIASADGAIYVLPNTTTNPNNITFGNPIKLVTTGLSTGKDGSYNGAQVVSMGDINKDGIPDIVVGSTDSSELFIYYGSRDNQNNLYFGRNDRNQRSNPNVVLYDYNYSTQGNQIVDKTVIRGQGIEDVSYRGPSDQKNANGGGLTSEHSEYTGGATNVILADLNKDGELDILLATDGEQFRPDKYKVGNSTYDFDLKIKHTSLNRTTDSPGGRVFYMARNPQSGKYINYFLGQYALVPNSTDADFDNATIVNFWGSPDFIATDENHTQTFFTFLQSQTPQNQNLFINADRFIIESKDLIRKNGTTAESFDFNNNSLYIKSITLKIVGNFRGIPTTISLANRQENNNPLYVNIPLDGSQLSDTYTQNNPLTIEVDFYPQGNNVVYRINNGPWITGNTSRMRGSSIFYKLEFDTSNVPRSRITSLNGQNVMGLNVSPEIRGIYVSYAVAPQSLKIRNWKEVR